VSDSLLENDFFR